MSSEERPALAHTNPFTAADVEVILREHGWLAGEANSETRLWMEEAAALLGPLAAERPENSSASEALAELLGLIFTYDARRLLADPENQAVMVREGAREVIRELANRILEGPEIDSDGFRRLIEEMKTKLGFHGRRLFHPLRLALAGEAGEGELDRVILLLDSAARAKFSAPVKGTRQRMIEFCAALG